MEKEKEMEMEMEMERVSSKTLRENDVALSLIEDLDERWFQDNVIVWSSSCGSSSSSALRTQSQDQSPLPAAVVVVERSSISPFRSIEMVQPVPAVVTMATTASSSSSALRAAAILGPREKNQLLRTRLERRRSSDGDCIPRRGLMFGDGERKVKLDAKLRCEEEVLRIKHHPDVKEETSLVVDAVTVLPNRHVNSGETRNELPALPLPTGQLTDVREDEELENRIFTKLQSHQIPGIRPSRLKTASSVDQLRVPLAESNNECQAQAQAQRKPRRRMKGTRSLTELEYDELRGWSDLGFKVSKDDLTPEVVSMLPGLKILGSEDGQPQPLRISSPRVRVYSPKHGMWIPRPESPVLNLHMPAIGEGDVDMKSQLKFWARAVASTVRIEC